jgi:thiosulfate dehydrogenase (quinone) large subunit
MNQMNGIYGKATAVLRIALGAGFLFAGLEKVFEFAGHGPFDATGYLKNATFGALPGSAPKALINPTHDFWVGLAGDPSAMSIVNILVQFGELAIGICLVLGLATRFAGAMGTLLATLLFVASWSFANGPFNELFMYAAVSLFVTVVGAGSVWGLDGFLARSQVLARTPARFLVF